MAEFSLLLHLSLIFSLSTDAENRLSKIMAGSEYIFIIIAEHLR
jgi:hypothetical protein